MSGLFVCENTGVYALLRTAVYNLLSYFNLYNRHSTPICTSQISSDFQVMSSFFARLSVLWRWKYGGNTPWRL